MHQVLHCVLLFTLTRVAWGYNFDIAVPTIVESGATFAGDGFGFSMTQHEFSDGRKVALVGSPRINGSDLLGNPVDREGGVFSCPFDNSQNCQREPVFQTKNDSNPLAQLLAPVFSTDTRSYEGELLGYSLRSFDNHVVACAPLYVSTIQFLPPIDGERYSVGTPNGRCVVLNRDLSELEEDVLQITNIDLSTSSMTMGGVDTNIIAMDIGGGVMERIAIGSVLSGATGEIPPGQVIVTSVDAATVGDSNVTADTGDRLADVTELLGYKIEVGRFTEDVLQIASSAPRANLHRGQIRIYNIPNAGVLPEQDTMIEGPQPDGYFGYDFVAHSFSEDGQYHSLVVGCPLCDRDQGAVFVYLHTGDRTDPFPSDPVHIPSPDPSVPGRFGMAVSVVGDIDRDGIADVAVSAPYGGVGGVVYICRGFRGGILPPEQAIPASPMASAFGYTLSGGLDIDTNGYPDLTVGDLSGHMTTVRASPLVSVVMEIEDPPTTVDLMDDRKCRINDDITLLCFDVTPCFYYEALHSVEIPQFAIQYTLTVDGNLPAPRVVSLSKRASDEIYDIITENVVSENITMTGSGEGNRVCAGPFTFAIRADFAEVTPIPVNLAVSESDSVPPLPEDLAIPPLGGPLTPVLRRYTQGDQPAITDITHEVNFGLNCDAGSSPACEPDYSVDITPSFNVNDTLLLVSGKTFSYDVLISNTASDDGLSPILVLDLPNGVVFERTVSNSMEAVTICESSSSAQVRCLLRNPMPGNSNLSLTVFYTFNSSAISLSTNILCVYFTVVDGPTGNSSPRVGSFFNVRAEASFDIGVIVTEDQYQATRHAITRNTQTIPLSQIGPVVRFSVLVSNSREILNGTTVPVATVAIHVPVAVQPDRDASMRPLLVPFQLLSTSNNINCNYFDMVSDNLLSTIQRPTNFIPLGAGPPPDNSPSLNECEAQRGELGVRCGTIVCSVRDLEAGRPPSQVTVFAYLFSPSIIARESFSIFADVSTPVGGLVITDPENDFTDVSFEVLPAVLEVPLDCFQYWIIVVSVVAGLLALLFLISLLACCGVFGRWYKRRGDEATDSRREAVDGDRSRFRSTVTPRTVPPLPSTISGGRVSGDGVRSEGGEEEKIDLDIEEEERRKSAEAEEERRLEAEIHATAAPHPPDTTRRDEEGVGDMDIPLDQFTFDPHVGVSDDGDETEI